MKILKKKKAAPAVFQRDMYLPKKKLQKKNRSAGGNAPHRRVRIIVTATLWALFVGVGGYVFFFSNLFRVTQEAVESGPVISPGVIRGLLDQKRAGTWLSIIRKDNLLFFTPKRVTALLESEFPLIETVSVERRFPGTLLIHAQEKPYQIIGCSADSCFVLTRDGHTEPIGAFSRHPDQQGTVYMVRDNSGNQPDGEGKFLEPETAVFLQKIIATFEEETGFAFEPTFEMSSRFASEIRVQTKPGFWIYFNTTTPLEESYTTLRTFLAPDAYGSIVDKLRYIDLRVPKRVYYTRTDQAPEDLIQEQKDQANSGDNNGTTAPAAQDPGTGGM